MKTVGDARKIGFIFIYWPVKQYRDDENKALLLKTAETKYKRVKIKGTYFLTSTPRTSLFWFFPRQQLRFAKKLKMIEYADDVYKRRIN